MGDVACRTPAHRYDGVHVFLVEFILLVATITEFRLSSLQEVVEVGTVWGMASSAKSDIRVA